MNPIANAAAIAPMLSEQSTFAERDRRMAQSTADTLNQAGLFRMLVPTVYGGLQVEPQVFFDALHTAAKADGAAGWISMIGSTTGLLSASLPQDWAEKIYGDHPNVTTVGVTAPLGRAVAAGSDGGDLQVTGRWPFGSGCQVADWICGGCFVYDGDKPVVGKHGQPEPLLVFFPADEVTIHSDSWHTSGLRGTGSHDIEVQKVTVPQGRWVTLGKRAQIDAPLYRFPTFGLLALGVSAVSLGIASRALEEFVALAGDKTPTGASRSLANRPSVQKELAQAVANLDSAKALTSQYIEEAWEQANGSGRLDIEIKAKLRLAATNNAWSAASVVDQLYHNAGGTSIYSHNKLQQCFRDVHVTTQHIMVGQPTYEAIGKVQLGIDPKQPL